MEGRKFVYNYIYKTLPHQSLDIIMNIHIFGIEVYKKTTEIFFGLCSLRNSVTASGSFFCNTENCIQIIHCFQSFYWRK